MGAANPVAYSRRSVSRREATPGLYVFWSCNGRDDLSRVQDISAGGLFLETTKRAAVGTAANLYFLVNEGTIRVDAVIRHVQPGRGLGLKFTGLPESDRTRFAALMQRLRAVV